MYAPLPNLPKKELLKVIEKCLFAPSKIESLDLSRSLGRNTTMNGTMEGNVQEKHAYFFASSHVTVYRHVTQMYRSCSSPRHHFWWKEGNMWLGSYSWAAAANIQLPLTVWRKWDWPYSILERLLAAWRCCVWRLGQLEMLFWSTCSIWINTMWAKIQDPRFLKCRQGPWAFLHHLQRFNFHAEHIFKCATTFNSASTKQVVK